MECAPGVGQFRAADVDGGVTMRRSGGEKRTGDMMAASARAPSAVNWQVRAPVRAIAGAAHVKISGRV